MNYIFLYYTTDLKIYHFPRSSYSQKQLKSLKHTADFWLRVEITNQMQVRIKSCGSAASTERWGNFLIGLIGVSLSLQQTRD